MTAKSAIVPPAAVAVIGLGNMGVPMGLRLIKAGFTVTSCGGGGDVRRRGGDAVAERQDRARGREWAAGAP